MCICTHGKVNRRAIVWSDGQKKAPNRLKELIRRQSRQARLQQPPLGWSLPRFWLLHFALRDPVQPKRLEVVAAQG
jgi:hypothetical protein